MTVQHVESLDLFAVAGEMQFAIGQHTIHVHQQAADFAQTTVQRPFARAT